MVMIKRTRPLCGSVTPVSTPCGHDKMYRADKTGQHAETRLIRHAEGGYSAMPKTNSDSTQ